MKFKIYCVAPISNLSYNEVVDYYHGVKCDLEAIGYDVLYPMCCKGYLKNEKDDLQSSGYVFPPSTDDAIFGRDRFFVQCADIILANFTNARRVSIGSMFELAWASMLGKHIIVVMDKDNVHQHSFVKKAAHIIFPTYEEAIQYLTKLSHNEI